MSNQIDKGDVENRHIKEDNSADDDSTNLLNNNTDLMKTNTVSFQMTNHGNPRKQKVDEANNIEDFDYFFDNVITIHIPFTQLKYEVTYCQTSKTIFGMIQNSIKVLNTLLFPGQGSQFVGMGKYILQDEQHSEWSQKLLSQYSRILNKDMQKLMLEGPQEEINQTENAQPAIFINSYISMLKYMKQNSIEDIKQDFSYALGNSVGEYSALVAADSIHHLDAVKLLQNRGKLMQKACENKKCAMLAILTSDIPMIQSMIDHLRSTTFPNEVYQIAVYASNKQLILSGEQAPLKQIQAELKKKHRMASVFLQVSAAFHCPLLTPIKDEFKKCLESIEIKPPQMKIYRNTDMMLYQSREDIIEGLVEQLDHPVLFQHSFEKILKLAFQSEYQHDNYDKIQFVELGTTGLLSKLGKDISLGYLNRDIKDIIDFINVY